MESWIRLGVRDMEAPKLLDGRYLRRGIRAVVRKIQIFRLQKPACAAVAVGRIPRLGSYPYRNRLAGLMNSNHYQTTVKKDRERFARRRQRRSGANRSLSFLFADFDQQWLTNTNSSARFFEVD